MKTHNSLSEKQGQMHTQTYRVQVGVFFIEAYKSFKAGFTNGPLRTLCCFGPITLNCRAAV